MHENKAFKQGRVVDLRRDLHCVPLHITGVDPIRYNLLLSVSNRERYTMPDNDLTSRW